MTAADGDGAAARPPVFALITGGGTGGHVYPALALADALVATGHPQDSIRFVGAARGLEASVVPAAGYAIDLLPATGLRRSWKPLDMLANIGVLRDALVSFVQARRIVRGARPRVVVGVGGYASLATVLAARLARVPVVIHEQNAAPGLANRIAVRLGARAAISLPGTPLAGAVLTGNPVRATIAAVEREPDASPPLVAVVGGSLGSGRLNDAALGLYDRWRAREDVRVRHVAGRRHEPACRRRLDALRRPADVLTYDLVAYEDRMDRLYAQTAVAVCRAGAVTVAELAAAGVPAVLVPWSGAANDHQTSNARALVDAGAAVLVPDAECDAVRLDAVASDLLGDPDRLARMSSAARALARPDAAAALAALVEEAAGARA